MKDKKTFNAVKNLYVNEKLSPEKISESQNVSSKQIYRWVEKYKWDEERKRIIADEAERIRKASIDYGLKEMIKDIKDVVFLIKMKLPSAELGTIGELVKSLNDLMQTLIQIQALDKMEEEDKHNEPLRIAK